MRFGTISLIPLWPRVLLLSANDHQLQKICPLFKVAAGGIARLRATLLLIKKRVEKLVFSTLKPLSLTRKGSVKKKIMMSSGWKEFLSTSL